MKNERSLALLFVTHDFEAARAIADRVAVMHEGAIVESGATLDVLAHPRHAHTRELLAACDPFPAVGAAAS